MSLSDYKPIEIHDKDIFREYLLQDPQNTSELTFTNLYMWRHKYKTRWRLFENCLLIIFEEKKDGFSGLPPIGRGDKKTALNRLAEDLEENSSSSCITRVSEELVNSFVDSNEYEVILDRDNSDYIYLAQSLINLSGRKYHRKKNHLNRFIKNHEFRYLPLDNELVECFLDMQDNWCRMRECVEKPDLLSEDYAIHEVLTRFDDLDYRGGAIVIKDRVEAFSLGEVLNKDMAVVHIEKANPDIPGLYTAINQMFCKQAWEDIKYINREQDLGIEGLRKAKESYYPDHLVNKYVVKRKA